MITFEEIDSEIKKLASKIDTNGVCFPNYETSIDFACPHIEIDNLGLIHYVIIEKGKELERQIHYNLESLLFRIFDDITFEIALKSIFNKENYESNLNKKRKELLLKINKNWIEKINF